MIKLKLPLNMRRFLKAQTLSCKKSTINTYTSSLRDFSSFLKSKFHTDSLTAKHISRINTDILDSYIFYLHQQRLLPYSAVNKFLAVRKYLSWEVDRGTISESSLINFSRSRLPKPPDYLPRPLSNQTDKALILKFRNSDNPYAKAFLLLRLTGLRISELINLPIDCILTTPKNENFLKVPLGKMNNERLVPLSDEALSIIQKLKSSHAIKSKHRNSNRLIGISGNIPKVYALLNLQFRKFTTNLSDQNKPITFHRLRHTYATSLLSAGLSIVSIMKLLGHRRIEMSLRYAQITPTNIRNEYLKAIASFEQKILPTPQTKSLSSFIDINELLFQLDAFIKNQPNFDILTQKKLARKFSALRKSLLNISNLKKFPILLP